MAPYAHMDAPSAMRTKDERWNGVGAEIEVARVEEKLNAKRVGGTQSVPLCLPPRSYSLCRNAAVIPPPNCIVSILPFNTRFMVDERMHWGNFMMDDQALKILGKLLQSR